MNKVFLVILEYENLWNGEFSREIRCTTTREKALVIFQEMVQEEKRNGWLEGKEQEDFEEYEETEGYLEAQDDDYKTFIYIKEVEVE